MTSLSMPVTMPSANRMVHNSFICVPWILHMCVNDSFIRVPWLNHMCVTWISTGLRRCIGCLKLQVIFRKRANNCKALLQKMTCKDKAFYWSSPPCMPSANLIVHDSFIRVPWVLHKCVNNSFICVPWILHMFVKNLFICLRRLIDMCMNVLGAQDDTWNIQLTYCVHV